MMDFQAFLRREVGYVQADKGYDITRFKFSSVSEFLNDLKGLPKDKKFPFVFVNSDTLTYDRANVDDTIVTVGEIVIATAFLDLRAYSSEEKDNNIFRPILTPFLEGLLFRLKYSANIAVYKEGKVSHHYRYGDGNGKIDSTDTLDETSCAIKLTNFQFRILTIKND